MPGLTDLATLGAGAVNPAALIPTGVQTAIGALQTIFSGRRKAEKQLENLKSPIYTPNRAIGDLYSTALNRYNVNPYQSAAYQTAMKNAQRTTATGLAGLQGRGAALAGASRLAGIEDDATQRAGAMAEQEQNRRFQDLSRVTGMKSADDRYTYQQNQVVPFENKRQLLAMKAGGASQRQNAGLQNLYGGLSGSALLMSGLK